MCRCTNQCICELDSNILQLFLRAAVIKNVGKVGNLGTLYWIPVINSTHLINVEASYCENLGN